MKRTAGWVATILMLSATGLLGLYSGVRELGYDLTPFQRSVSTGVLAYGILGVSAAVGVGARRRWSVWLASAWAVIITYVASTAALAYAPNASLVGAVAAGIASALIGVAVVWAARAAVRHRAAAGRGPDAGAKASLLVLLLCTAGAGGCQTLYGGPPVVVTRGTDRQLTKRIRAKREPDRLIADDLTVCFVIPEVFQGLRPGDAWRCEWRPVPDGR